MSKANELKTITALVKNILEKDRRARNSDSVLYFKVLEHIAEEKQIDLHRLTVPGFLLCRKQLGLPCHETVRRTRQKVQAEFPELRASAEIEAERAGFEAAYREYARECVL